MLNDYHLRFIRHFNDHGVRFLIVGGQARHFLFGTPTRDLDLWVDLSDDNIPVLEDALIAWAEEYQSHTSGDWKRPLPLRRSVQMQFPKRDAMYMTDSCEMVEISAEDGIDVLTSLSDFDFAKCMDRSIICQISVGEIRHLCASDLEASDYQQTGK